MNHLFEVVRKIDGQGMMYTDCESCINYDMAVSQIESGFYAIKVNGKITSKTNLKKAVSDALAAGVGHPATNIVCDDDQEERKTVKEELESDKQEANSESAINLNTKKSKAVICIDTNEVFKNQSEAAKHFGIDPAQVSDSIKTGRPRSGHTFQRFEGDVD